MFPIRVVNTGAAATRFLYLNHLHTAGFVSAIAYDLKAAKNACAASILQRRSDLKVNHLTEASILANIWKLDLCVALCKLFKEDIGVSQLFGCAMGFWISNTIFLLDIWNAENHRGPNGALCSLLW